MKPPISTTPRFICLTGFMGSGKSTVGAALADVLHHAFIDLDSEIVKRECRTIAEIFRSLGERHFRQLETEVLQLILQKSISPTVIALGGGTFIQSINRDLVRSHHAITIYLEGDFDLLLTRCRVEDGTRPLMEDAERFQQLFQERQPIYRSADLIVQVADKSPQEIAVEIAALLKSRIPAR